MVVMKTLKFHESLVELILQGKKKTTWRLFDDKDLSVGDEVTFLIWKTLEEFAKAKIISVKEKTFGELVDEDWDGHEKFSSDEEMYEGYKKYYNRQVGENSLLRIVRFELQ